MIKILSGTTLAVGMYGIYKSQIPQYQSTVRYALHNTIFNNLVKYSNLSNKHRIGNSNKTGDGGFMSLVAYDKPWRVSNKQEIIPLIGSDITEDIIHKIDDYTKTPQFRTVFYREAAMKPFWNGLHMLLSFGGGINYTSPTERLLDIKIAKIISEEKTKIDTLVEKIYNTGPVKVVGGDVFLMDGYSMHIQQ